jgi:hyaluronan synthase
MSSLEEPTLEHPFPAQGWSTADWPILGAILVGLAGICWATLCTHALGSWLGLVGERRWADFLERPSTLWAGMGTLLLCVRTALWMRYRPAAPASLRDAPRLTVIIPAYNEGAMVRRAIDSAATAHYPSDRLEVFAVDDGSTDDTWEHIRRAADRHGGRVTAVRLPKNMGKRRALAEGIRRATGDVIVTMDSDSEIEPAALLAMAGPFRERRVGAVAGKVDVLNREAGLIPRMLGVRFVLSFDFLRAVQSTYGTVYCCPGALTAYRAAAIRPLLDRWLNSTFLGAPCTFGEDRDMTNLVLGAGLDTVYQRNAVVRTIVPTTYARLCKMFIRWDRSYVREEIRYLGIVWRRPPRAFFLSIFETLVNNLRFPISYVSFALLTAGLVAHPMRLLRILFVIGLFELFNALYYLKSERSPDFLYGVLYGYFAFFGLFWIFPYAAVTVRARSWLTR